MARTGKDIHLSEELLDKMAGIKRSEETLQHLISRLIRLHQRTNEDVTKWDTWMSNIRKEL